MSETKKCPKCGETKPRTEFYKNAARSGGISTYCKVCEKTYSRVKIQKYRRSRQGKRSQANTSLKRRVGFTLDEYDVMFMAQGGVCAICGKPEMRKYNGIPTRLCVDHDHETGKVRQLLCIKCNFVVGLIDEDTDILLKASEYLRQHKDAA